MLQQRVTIFQREHLLSSSINFTNKKNKKHQSLSVSKNSNVINSRFNQTFNNTEKKNLFQSNLNLTQHIKLQSQEYVKMNKIQEMNNKISMKKNDIERINKLIDNIKNDIRKYDNEIKSINKIINDEEQEEYKLRQMINFLLNMK